MIHESIKARQSSVSKEGREFQVHVQNLLNSSFIAGSQQICIQDGNEIVNDSLLKEMFYFPVKGFKKVWGDVDLVAKNLISGYPIALISCKLSLHGRFTETLFYSRVYKDKIPDLKVVFATPDKGRQATSGSWKTEWGTPENPTKDRFLAETYLDGVYIDNEYLQKTWGFEGKTALGGKIKSISQLNLDLMEWSSI
jgi:hypothetical protein